MFRGNDVKYEDNEHAIFNDGGSTASLMSASKACDAIALLPNCSGEQSDAVAAHTQAELGGILTWVSLPRDQWLPNFDKNHKPVVLLKKALYGHPKAGDYWERHCHAAVLYAYT